MAATQFNESIPSWRLQTSSVHEPWGNLGLTEHSVKGLILAQNERWRHGLGMQVERIPVSKGIGGSGERGSNTWITYPGDGHSRSNERVIPSDSAAVASPFREMSFASGGVHAISASWWGNGLPRRRRLAGVRARPAPLALRHWPDTYGWLQSRIFVNGRKPERAMPRER